MESWLEEHFKLMPEEDLIPEDELMEDLTEEGELMDEFDPIQEDEDPIKEEETLQ